jgi:hypothetical protein
MVWERSSGLAPMHKETRMEGKGSDWDDLPDWVRDFLVKNKRLQDKNQTPALQHRDGSVVLDEATFAELKKVLSYMDHLLESLSDEKIREFALSDNFVLYKGLFDKLGIYPPKTRVEESEHLTKNQNPAQLGNSRPKAEIKDDERVANDEHPRSYLERTIDTVNSRGEFYVLDSEGNTVNKVRAIPDDPGHFSYEFGNGKTVVYGKDELIIKMKSWAIHSIF